MKKTFAQLFLWGVLGCILSGCAKDQSLDRLISQQQATLQVVNQELERLNHELQQAKQSKEDLAKAKVELEEKLSQELEAGDMAVSLQNRGLVVTVLDRVLFDSGKADLKDSSTAALDKIADILTEKVHGHMIYIEGHTDNAPIRFSGWRSNWELSTARATEVIHYFTEQKGFQPERLAAVGYGEFHPVTANDNPQGRLLNRRVEIVISPKTLTAASTVVGN